MVIHETFVRICKFSYTFVRIASISRSHVTLWKFCYQSRVLIISSLFSVVTRCEVNPFGCFSPDRIHILFDRRRSRYLVLILFQHSRMSLLIYTPETSLWLVKDVDELCLWIALFRLKLNGNKLQLWIWKQMLSTMLIFVITSISLA